ncbi:YggT family protein [Legionella londiniensis]|uniref:YggT family protein n=1 Tax=Legionella londiniensis TaxID=45068 RepID=A0A0W0VR78_9GAMM|nr:YggT family protein [Legionella londiniensis]KTD22595.1 YggT family protein [Legionella londiniensis]STX92526.1 Integral membrane protein YggT, involved in response to extracytoplasmic stress (osmotic shock) [Legionella londiniensis]
MAGLTTVGYFLFNLFFSLLIFLLWARIALRYLRVSSLHPVSRMIHTLTDAVIQPINRLLFQGSRQSRYDWACITFLVLVEIIKFVLLALLFYGAIIPIVLLFICVLADLIVQPLDLLFYAIIIRVILSWVNPMSQHPIAEILRLITEPVLQWGRRLVPDISGFDFSPILILVIIKIITIFIRASIPLV